MRKILCLNNWKISIQKNIFLFSDARKKKLEDQNNLMRSKKSVFIDEKTQIKKFEKTITPQPPTKFEPSEKSSFNEMDFDIFTKKISDSNSDFNKIKEIDYQNIIPWNSDIITEIPKEKNILTPIDLYHVIKEEEAQKIFKNFLIALQKYDFESLGNLIENSFLSKLKKNLADFKNLKNNISFENIEEDQLSIDLFNIDNIFAVGTYLNRKRNLDSSRYILNNSYFQKIPIKQIILKRLKENDKGSFIIHLHLAITTNIKIKIYNATQELIYQDLKSPSIHSMILETELLDFDYRSLKSLIKIETQNQGKTNNPLFGTKEKNPILKIIDFDNFMKGNPLVRNNFFNL